jgi:hypothetical protein
MDQFTSSGEKMGRHIRSWVHKKELVSIPDQVQDREYWIMDNSKNSVIPSIVYHCENHLESTGYLGLTTKYNLVHVLQNKVSQ